MDKENGANSTALGMLKKIKRILPYLFTGIFCGVLLLFMHFYWSCYMNKKITTSVKEVLETELNTLRDTATISQIVDPIVKERSVEILKNEIETKITPLISSVEDDATKASELLEDSEENKRKFAQILEVIELELQAMNGYRKSFELLKNIAKNPNHYYRNTAFRIATNVFEKYNTRTYFREWYKENIANERIIQLLGSKNNRERKIAVYSIAERKMYDQISVLISMVVTEGDLDVLAALTRVLNETLKTDVKVLQDDAEALFLKEWEDKKEQIFKAQEQRSTDK
ncbi:hypothetical protein ACFL1T_00650 [Chlamydiota bacterium]